MTKQKIITAFMLVSVLVLTFAKRAEANGSVSVETLAQHALEKHWKKWLELLPHTHRRDTRGSQSIEWDEYDLKSSIGKTILRKYGRYNHEDGKNRYQVIQVDNRGGLSKPSDDLLRRILRENNVANFKDYVGILEGLTPYKTNNVKVSLSFYLWLSPHEMLEIFMSQNGEMIGSLYMSGMTKPEKLTGALRHVGANKVAYLEAIEIEKSHRELGLSYPVMCASFHAAREIYGDEYVLLSDQTIMRPGIYEKIGFKPLEGGATLKLKWATISDLLNSDKCKFMNR